MHWLYNNPYSKAAFVGGLLGGGLLHPWLWPLVLLGASGFFWLQTQCSSLRQRLVTAWLVGSVQSFLVLSWAQAVLPLDWLADLTLVTQYLLFSIYVIPAAVVIGSGLCLVAFVYHYTATRPRWQRISSVAVVWLVSELVGAFAFSLFTLGPGSTLNLLFSFGFSGYALSGHGLLYWAASFLGVYGLSLVIGWWGVVSTDWWPIKKRWAFYLFVFMIGTSFLPTPVWQSPAPVSVTLVETDIPITLTASLADADTEQVRTIVLEAVTAAVQSGSTYIVLPEDLRFTAYFPDHTFALLYLESLTDMDFVLVDSSRTQTPEATHLRTYIYDTKSDQVYQYDKQYLVPQGEYIPYVYHGLLSWFGGPGFTRVRENNVYRPGIKADSVTIPEYIPPVLFCFESVAPTGVRTTLRNRPEVPFVAHIVSHAWFQQTPHTLWHQLDAMLTVQAQFNGVPILQAANQTPLKVYYPDGTIRYPEVTQAGMYWEIASFSL